MRTLIVPGAARLANSRLGERCARRICALLTRTAAIAGLAACGVLVVPASKVDAQERIPITVIDAYAPAALWVRVFIDFFMPEVDRRLAEAGTYEIRWTSAFGGTVAKTGGVLDALQYGLADIGIVTTPFHPDKIPFYNISYVTPFVTTDIGLVARTVNDLVEAYPVLKSDWANYHQVYLTTAGSIDSYELFLAQPITSVEDIRGRKIAGVGLNLRYLEGVGGVGVSSDLGDFYNNVATGLVTGAIAWAESAASYKLYEVAPYMIDVGFGAATSKVITMNERTWNRLPRAVQTVFANVAIEYSTRLAEETERRGEQSRSEFERHGGSIVPVSLEQRRAWARTLPNMAVEWADDLERRGLPGRQILRDYMNAMREANQPIMRQWDRE